MSHQPEVSIIIPTYNRAAMLEEAIYSIQQQSYKNWELLIADDGSTDDTRHRVGAINDPRIRLLSLPHCGNIARVRNAGVAAGTGHWLAFLDADDQWLPAKLEKQLEKAGNREWGYGRFEMMDEQGKTIPTKAGSFNPEEGNITAALLTNDASAAIGTLMITRTLFETVGGFDVRPELLYREDIDLVFRVSLVAEAFAETSLVTRIREHPGRSTNKVSDAHERTAFLYGHFLRLCKVPAYRRIAKKRQSYHIAEMAITTGKNGNRQLSIKRLGQAFFAGASLLHLASIMRKRF